jgi:hypothetical protein
MKSLKVTMDFNAKLWASPLSPNLGSPGYYVHFFILNLGTEIFSFYQNIYPVYKVA